MSSSSVDMAKPPLDSSIACVCPTKLLYLSDGEYVRATVAPTMSVCRSAGLLVVLRRNEQRAFSGDLRRNDVITVTAGRPGQSLSDVT